MRKKRRDRHALFALDNLITDCSGAAGGLGYKRRGAHDAEKQ
jgi:hypothetical protein